MDGPGARLSAALTGTASLQGAQRLRQANRTVPESRKDGRKVAARSTASRTLAGRTITARGGSLDQYGVKKAYHSFRTGYPDGLLWSVRARRRSGLAAARWSETHTLEIGTEFVRRPPTSKPICWQQLRLSFQRRQGRSLWMHRRHPGHCANPLLDIFALGVDRSRRPQRRFSRKETTLHA